MTHSVSSRTVRVTSENSRETQPFSSSPRNNLESSSIATSQDPSTPNCITQFFSLIKSLFNRLFGRFFNTTARNEAIQFAEQKPIPAPKYSYHYWLNQLPPAPAAFKNRKDTFGINVANLDFEYSLDERIKNSYEPNLSAFLKAKGVTVEGFKPATDIETLKAQMKQVGWSEDDMNFILPHLSGPRIDSFANAASTKVKQWIYQDKNPEEIPFKKMPVPQTYFCFIDPKGDLSQICFSSQYFNIGSSSGLELRIKMNYHQNKWRFLADFSG